MNISENEAHSAIYCSENEYFARRCRHYKAKESKAECLPQQQGFASLLRLFKSKIEKCGILLCGSMLCIFGVCLAFVFDFPWPLLFLQYLGYFVLGWGLKRTVVSNNRLKAISIVGSLTIMLFAILFNSYNGDVLIAKGRPKISVIIQIIQIVVIIPSVWIYINETKRYIKRRLIPVWKISRLFVYRLHQKRQNSCERQICRTRPIIPRLAKQRKK